MAQETVLLVIGNWGSGKSATANTILGYDAFPKNNSTTGTVTQPAVRKSQDKKLTVVDGLSMWGKDPDKLDKDTLLDAQNAVSKCGNGFNAILVVMKYGEKYSEEDARVVAGAKKVFGPKIFEEYGVCVFTRGDDFKYAVEEGEEPCKSFPEWCKRQTGSLRQLFGDCGRRCVLINNREKDPRDKNDLLQIVSHLSKNGTKRYTLNEFQKCHGRTFSSSVNKTIEKGFRDKLENLRKQLHYNPTRADLQKMIDDLSAISKDISQSPIDQKLIENLICEAQKLTTNIKMQLDTRSANGDKEILTVKPGVSDRSTLAKDRTMPCVSEKSTLAKDRTMPGVSDKSTLAKDSDSLRFKKDYFSQGTDVDVQNKAAQADKLINDFTNNILLTNGADLKKQYDIMKFQVLDLIKSTPYFDHFKSKVARLEQEIHNKPDLESFEVVNTDPMEIGPDSEETSTTLTEKEETADGIKLLLLGRSGNGKSSTGNSILGRHAFQISSSTAATKSNITIESQKFEQFTVSVVDGPSLDDIVLNASTDLDKLLNSMKEALQFCAYAFSGLLVILKFGQRFTKQEKDAIGLIKSILGKDVLKKYGVCVMTHGDNYEYEMEEERIDFPDWCRMQQGEFVELFEECSYRCVLFDNKTKDEQVQIKQRNKVLDFLKRGEKYSEEEFLDAEKDFKELSIQCAMPKLEEANSVIMTKIREKLQQLEQEFPNCDGRYRTELESLQQGLQEYKHNIESLGHNATTDYLIQLVSTLQMQINSKLRLCQQTEELRQLDKEKVRIKESVSSPLSPTRMGRMGEDKRPTNSPIKRNKPSSEVPWAMDTASCNYEPRKHLIELNDFIQNTELRWGEANRAEPSTRLHYKGVIIKDIDFHLSEAAKRGETVEASDRACAELMQIKETIQFEINREEEYLAKQSYYHQSAHSTFPAESGFEMVYPVPEVRHETVLKYPHLTYPHGRHISSPGFIQQPKVTKYYPNKSPKGNKLKKFIIKRWSEIESFLKHLTSTSNNFSV